MRSDTSRKKSAERMMACDLITAECEVEIYRKQLRASRAAFHAIVERSGDGVLVLTQEGTIAFVNPAAEQLLGRPAGSLYGETLRIPLVPGEVSEIDVVKADGTTRVAELRVSETEWQNRAAWIVTLRDVTEQKNAEKRIRDAVRRRDEFLALLSHELRNPLAAIRNAAAILQRATEEPGSVRSVEVINRQCHQMARLLDDLLETSRVSQGKIQLYKEPLDLRVVLAEALEAVVPQVEARKHRLVVDAPLKPIPLEGDAARLMQVFSNLLTNACKYTDPEGRIEVRCECEGGEVLIRIIDNGVGIPADILADIFEPFVQATPAVARSQDTGLGLGLSLVRTLVEMHGGSVEGLSDGPGCGSEFVVRLPLSHAKLVVEPDETPAPAVPADSIRIVLVEDNPDVREMLKTLLDLDGHEVGTAGDGQQAIEMIDLNRPDVAIVDIGLPVLDGYEVARRVRQNPENAGVYLIALTGYGQADDRQRAMDAGFDTHLVKPVDLNRLNELLIRRPRAGDNVSPSGDAGSSRLTYVSACGALPALRRLPRS